jgi:hypothetical protein
MTPWCARFSRRFVLFLAVAAGAAIVAAGTVSAIVPANAWALEHFAVDDAGTQYPDSSDARKAADPTIRAFDARTQQIQLDGVLNDAAWQSAEAGRGFSQWDPDRGATPAEQTVFKVAYDEGAIYFAVACYESDPTKISAKLSRRDSFSSSDIVAVYLDPYHDRTTGYAFKVNPLGVQQDVYVYNDGEIDNDWDAVWEAETSRDDKGWYAEIRIPFSAIRYRSAPDMTWGINVWRYMHGRGQDTSWKAWSRDLGGFVSRFATVSGIRGIRAPRQLEFLPYALQRETDPAMASNSFQEDKWDGFQNVGLDMKYGLTSDLTMNATIQPDFGQVEADPATLNLSPFETFYEEKRPFFIEGSRFFQQPEFTTFYTRRIGTGDENTRIRYAAKVTGKMVGGVSVAALAASTDITGDGLAHNLFKSGERLSRYAVGRFGKEFSQGRYRFNVMQTAALNTADRATWGDRASREAYTTGFDFALSSKTRAWNVNGSFVGSVVNPEPLPSNPTLSDKPRYGTGGELSFNKTGGKQRGNVGFRWESDKLELNDLGFLEAPDEMVVFGWTQLRLNQGGKSKTFNSGNLNYNISQSWLYAGRKGIDPNTNLTAWEYHPGHRQYGSTNVNGFAQFRNFREAWFGIQYNVEGTHRYETRGGPLIREPTTYGGWGGFATDRRKTLVLELEGNHFRDTALNHSTNANVSVTWNQSSAVNHEVGFHFENRIDDTQYLETVDLNARPGGKGIGGYSYVFGRIHQQVADMTLRSNILFNRKQSLEIYAQPFITVGDYHEARELSRPDSYEFIHYDEPGYNPRDFDFSFAAVNTNVVYRWEYRPGSTFFLVWTQSRADYQERWFSASGPAQFRNSIGTGNLFRNEPENRFLAKVTYWLPI